MTASEDHRPGASRPRASRPPADLGPVQVLRHTGLEPWQWEAGTQAGLIPPPGSGGRWPTAVADQITARRDEIVAAVGTEAPVGGHRAAARLAARTGLDVDKPDVEALAAARLLAAAGSYKGWPLWDCRALDALDPDQVTAVVAERQAWIAASVSVWDAPGYLGWHRQDLKRAAVKRGLRPGPLDRYARADLDALAADEDLAADRLLTASQAAGHLEIRPADFAYLVAGDLAVPRSHAGVRVSRYRWVDVPLYRAGDLDALREHPGIDWEAARAVRAGQPSPLRHLARRPVDRAAVIRRWCAELGDRHGIEVWCWYRPATGQWEVDFERIPGGPSAGDVRAAITAHRYLGAHADSVAVATEAGAAIRWARAMREPGAAVILDTVIRADECLSDQPGGSASHSVVPVRVSGRSGCRVCGLSVWLVVAKASCWICADSVPVDRGVREQDVQVFPRKLPCCTRLCCPHRRSPSRQFHRLSCTSAEGHLKMSLGCLLVRRVPASPSIVRWQVFFAIRVTRCDLGCGHAWDFRPLRRDGRVG